MIERIFFNGVPRSCEATAGVIRLEINGNNNARLVDRISTSERKKKRSETKQGRRPTPTTTIRQRSYDDVGEQTLIYTARRSNNERARGLSRPLKDGSTDRRRRLRLRLRRLRRQRDDERVRARALNEKQPFLKRADERAATRGEHAEVFSLSETFQPHRCCCCCCKTIVFVNRRARCRRRR